MVTVEEKIKRITIILSIIFIVMLIFRACAMSPGIPDSGYYHKKHRENKILTILKMPFFYVLEYPKIIMGISNGDIIDGGSTTSEPVKAKQYLKF